MTYPVTVHSLRNPDGIMVHHTPINHKSWLYIVNSLSSMAVTWKGGEDIVADLSGRLKKYGRTGDMVPTLKITADTYEVFTPFTIPFYTPFDVFSLEDLQEGFVGIEDNWRSWRDSSWTYKFHNDIVERVKAGREPMKIIMTKNNKWYETYNLKEVRRNS